MSEGNAEARPVLTTTVLTGGARGISFWNGEPLGPAAAGTALPVDEDGELPDAAAEEEYRRHDEEWEFIRDFCRSHRVMPGAQRMLSSRQVQILVRMIEGEWGNQ